MAAVTRLGLYGGPRAPYAGFVAAAASCALTSTITDEASVVAGGAKTVLEITNDTWAAAGAAFNAQRQAIIDGLDSAQSETTGWNAEVRDKEVVGAVVRTSNTVVTITWTAAPTYDITADETITATVPAAALVTSAIDVVATPKFDVTFVEDVSRRGGGLPPRRRKKPQRPEYERRDAEKAALQRAIEDAYAKATGEQRELPPETVAEVREVLRSHTTSVAKVRLPKPSTVDFRGLAQDTRAAMQLMRALDRRRDDEEAAALLLLMAA